MFYVFYFLPILLFVTLFVGSGIYFSLQGSDYAFYQLSPLVAILPSIMLGWILYKGKTEERMHAFLEGVSHKDIITMCIIFLLAGAFSQVTKDIGSIAATVNLALAFIPSHFLMIGIFLIAAFISTAIGTSMGTIATIAPIAVGLSAQAGLALPVSIATVVGGAMFGDSLSIISDTTIAAVMSQEADMKKKLLLNAKVALVAAGLTIALLMYGYSSQAGVIEVQDYSLLLIVPYALLLTLAFSGTNVFSVLALSIVTAGIVGCYVNPAYGIIALSQSIAKGFASMHEIIILSMLVGGLSGLASQGFKELAQRLSFWIKNHGGKKTAQFCIAGIVSLFDLLLANNTVAIIFSGGIARDVAQKSHIPAHYSAAWLDIYSCVFQGIIPYGAQILLASTVAGISPLEVVPYVYFCFILFAVATVHIFFKKNVV